MPLYIVQRKRIRQTQWEDFICVDDKLAAMNRKYFEERERKNDRYMFRVVMLIANAS